MARTDTLGHFLTDVADAIREKKGSVDTIAAEDFDTEIENLPSGGHDWSAIGYTEEPGVIQDGYDYALDVKNNWDSSITNAYQLFYSNTHLVYFPDVDTSNITNPYNMFSYCRTLQQATIDLPNATTVYNLFSNCSALHTAKVSFSNKCTSCASLFDYCTSLKHFDISECDFSNITSINRMFCQNTNLEEIDLSQCNFTNKLTNIYNVFNGSANVRTINFGEHFDTSNITSLAALFANCASLTTIIGMNNFDTRNVTSMNGMFMGGYSSPMLLTSLDLSNFQTPVLTDTQNMFVYCKNLIHIDMRNFDFSNVTSYNSMFGSSASNGVPADCEIIVANQTQKDWITSNFSWLTNVKTVAEYEAEQSE